jgi:hypothetical protein
MSLELTRVPAVMSLRDFCNVLKGAKTSPGGEGRMPTVTTVEEGSSDSFEPLRNSPLSTLKAKPVAHIDAPREAPNFFQRISASVDAASEIGELVTQIKEILAFSGTEDSPIIENLHSRVEDFCFFMITVNATSSPTTMVLEVMKYIKTFIPEPITKKIFHLLIKLASDKYQTQASGDEIRLLDILSDWKAYRHHPLAKFVGDIITVLSIAGLAPDYGESVLCSEIYDILGAKVSTSYTSATRFIDVAVSITKYVAHTVVPCIESKDFSLILYPIEGLETLEEEYAAIIACKTHIKSGRLDLIGETTCFSNEADLSARISELITKVTRIIRETKSDYIKNICTQRLCVLRTIVTDLEVERMNSPMKEQPFAIKVFGGSSVGKSKFTQILLAHIANAIGIPYNADTVCNQNAAETSFDSNYKSKFLIMLLDDICNKRAIIERDSPLDRLLRIINMVPATALKAGVEDKGTTPYRVKLLAATTNSWNLDANYWSNEPASILRRFNLHFDVKLRKECVGPDGGPKLGVLEGAYPDCWEVDVYRVKIAPRTSLVQKESYWDYEKLLSRANLRDCIVLACDTAREWTRRQQRAVTEANLLFGAKFCKCGWTECVECDHSNTRERQRANSEEILFEKPGVEPAKSLDADMPFSGGHPAFIPLELPVTGVEDDVLEPHAGGECKPDADPILPDWDVPVTPSFAETFRQAYAAHKSKIPAVFGAIMTALALYKTFSFFTGTERAEPHGTCSSELDVTTLPKSHNVWKKVEISPLPKSTASSTAVAKDVLALLKRSVAIFEYTKPGDDRSKPKYCMALPVRENLWLVPWHVVNYNDTLQVVIRYDNVTAVGRPRASCSVSREHWVRVGKSDLAVVRVIGAGSQPNVGKFFSPHCVSSANEKAIGVVRNFLGEVTQHVIEMHGFQHFTITGDNGEDLGGKKIRSSFAPGFKAYRGLCMMPLVTISSRPSIIGVHVAGSIEGSKGVIEPIDMSNIEHAIAELDAKFAFCIPSEGDFPNVGMNQEIEVQASVPTKHCSRFMPIESEGVIAPHNATVYGEHNFGIAKFRSQVTKSPISDSITKHTGYARKHGAPMRKPPWHNFQREFDIISTAENVFDPRVLDVANRAIKRFWDFKILDNPSVSKECVKPLSYLHSINGVDGVKGFEKIDRNTSVGLPLKGPKKPHMRRLEEEVPGVSEPWTFTDESGVYDDYLRIRQCYARGERAYPLFCATEKDEPVAFTKEKRRIFANCPVSMIILMRQYYLPVIKLIQDNWELTGSAVGINAHGQDWDRLHSILTTHGDDRIVAGDYSAFDKRATAEFTLRACHMFIYIAEKCGYDKEALTMMRGIAADIAFPVYDWQGVLVQFFASIVSGISITVHLNNFVNLHYIVYGYYANYLDAGVPTEHLETAVRPFWESLVWMTYGDDNILGVARHETYFNHSSLQRQLAKIQVKYTMADKSDGSIPFINIGDADFLKRSFRKHENGFVCAPIAIDSILKSLHNVKGTKGDVLPEHVSAQALYSAMLELYQHGADTFYWWRERLVRVAKETPVRALGEGIVIEDLLPGGHLPTWDMCTQRYFDSFPEEEISTDEEWEAQSGDFMRCDFEQQPIEEWCILHDNGTPPYQGAMSIPAFLCFALSNLAVKAWVSSKCTMILTPSRSAIRWICLIGITQPHFFPNMLYYWLFDIAYNVWNCNYMSCMIRWVKDLVVNDSIARINRDFICQEMFGNFCIAPQKQRRRKRPRFCTRGVYFPRSLTEFWSALKR